MLFQNMRDHIVNATGTAHLRKELTKISWWVEGGGDGQNGQVVALQQQMVVVISSMSRGGPVIVVGGTTVSGLQQFKGQEAATTRDTMVCWLITNICKD